MSSLVKTVTIGQNSQSCSNVSLLITIFTIIKSRLSLVFVGKNCHKRYKLSKCSELSQLFKIVTINQNCQIVQNCHICTKFFNLALTVIIGDNYHNWSHLFKIVTIGLICQRQTGQHWLYQVWTSLNKFWQDWTNLDKFAQG